MWFCGRPRGTLLASIKYRDFLPREPFGRELLRRRETPGADTGRPLNFWHRVCSNPSIAIVTLTRKITMRDLWKVGKVAGEYKILPVPEGRRVLRSEDARRIAHTLGLTQPETRAHKKTKEFQARCGCFWLRSFSTRIEVKPSRFYSGHGYRRASC